MTRMDKLPEGYVQCTWCRAGIRPNADGSCPKCSMTAVPKPKQATGRTGPSKRDLMAPRINPLDPTPVGRPVLGIDPGYRFVGVVLRDGDAVLYSTTLVREKERKLAFEWARLAVEEIKIVLFTACPPGTRIGVEGVSAPKGFSGGKQAPLNPEAILFTGVVFGAVIGTWPEAAIVPPGGNGSQHLSHYPPALTGRRPKDLPGADHGAGTRDHEKSAYDVAGKAAPLLYPPPPRQPLL